MDEAQVAQLMMSSGFAETRRTKKVMEFASLKNRKIVYFERKVGLPSSAKMIIHPDESLTPFDGILGVEAATSGSVHHHSNMTAFPKRQNAGKALIPYGRPLRVFGTAALPKFAAAFHLL